MSKIAKHLSLVVLVAAVLAACVPNPEPTEDIGPVSEAATAADIPVEVGEEAPSNIPNGEGEGPMTMALTSPAFNDGESIPVKYTCDGEDISPGLNWFGEPEDTVSLALIMDDPDAPSGTWVHWVLYNLPRDLPGLREGMTGVALDGTNSWNRTGYGGPCPPSGTHRYFFKVYALDDKLDLDPGADKESLLSAMEGHILGQAELMGTYSR